MRSSYFDSVGRLLLRIVSVCCISLISACDRSSPDPGNTTTGIQIGSSALDIAKQQADQGNWLEADKQIRQALLQDSKSPDVLETAARIAFANGDSQSAANLLIDACNSDQYESRELIRRATIALVSVGRIYEAIDLLKKTLDRYPERHQQRRELFDFLVSVEERNEALPHGQVLVRARRFDHTLLFSLSTHNQRDMETESLNILSNRNPEDARLRLAEIRDTIDHAPDQSVIEDLRAITDKFPGNIPANLLLGRQLVERGKFDELRPWHDRLPPRAKDRWQYWEILGDWAINQRRHVEAARAYWESTRCNPDIGEVLGKFSSVLLLVSAQQANVERSDIAPVHERAQLVARFEQQKDRFIKSGKRSQDLSAQIARTLLQLGRLWEAEAWAALAIGDSGSSDTEKAPTKRAREEILRALRSETPWQLSQYDPASLLDLSHLPMVSLTVKSDPIDRKTKDKFRPSVPPTLSEEAIARGIGHLPRALSATDNKVIPLYAQFGSGGCTLDFNLDGWPDLFFGQSGGTPGERDSQSNFLYQNRGGYFTDITAEASAGDSGYTQGVSSGDINEDGFDDLVIMNYGVNQLLINNGDGTFRNGDKWFPESESTQWSTSAAIADINHDGLADMICTRYCSGTSPIETQCSSPDDGSVAPCLPTDFPASNDLLLLGTETGKFQNASDAWSLGASERGRGLGVVVGNFDSQPGCEIFIANDMTSNHYWRVEDAAHSATFKLVESATLQGLALNDRFQPQACMGVSVGDLDVDGDIDYYVTNFEDEHNTFYEQIDTGVWSDSTKLRGIYSAGYKNLGFGSQAIDFDNDSYLEMIVANGHIEREPISGSPYAQPVQILRFSGESQFEAVDLSKSGEYLNRNHVGRALWSSDIDRDGKMDAVITHQNSQPALLVNRTTNDHSWIRLSLIGRDSSRNAVGSTVTVRTTHFERINTLTAGNGYFCANERALHFGLGPLGDQEKTVEIEVTWPSGRSQKESVSPNGFHLIVEGESAFELN